MDSIGDYIYLIIIGIAALSSFLKKKKPNESSTTLPQDVLTDYQEDDYEEVIEEVFEPAMEQSSSSSYNQKIESSNKPKISSTEYLSYETTINSSELRSKKQVSRLQKSSHLVTYDDDNDNEQYAEDLDIQFKTPADARLAFVYSEIFNKKY